MGFTLMQIQQNKKYDKTLVLKNISTIHKNMSKVFVNNHGNFLFSHCSKYALKSVRRKQKENI